MDVIDDNLSRPMACFDLIRASLDRSLWKAEAEEGVRYEKTFW